MLLADGDKDGNAMTWQYRLMKRAGDEPCYEVVEYYEDDTLSPSWTEAGASPSGETPAECKRDYEMMAEAFALPVLDETALQAERGRG